uniref:Uncharacterized protein n=1 Tax=Fervidicoccus fontis TaxID=683846 RepID=A0A7J3SL54_9CREN
MHILKYTEFLNTKNLSTNWYHFSTVGEAMKQVKFYIDDERYERLKRMAEEQKLSVPAYVKSLILRTLGEEEPGLEERVKYLMRRQEQITKEVGRIGVDLIDLAKRVERLERDLQRKATSIA